MPHQQAGYTDAILSLSPPSQYLAKREETIYGLRCCAPNPTASSTRAGEYIVGRVRWNGTYLRDVVPIEHQFATEAHGIFINHIDVFREIRCDSVAIDQDQGLSQCHWDQAKGRNRHEAVAKSYNAHHRIGVSRNVDGIANTLDGE